MSDKDIIKVNIIVTFKIKEDLSITYYSYYVIYLLIVTMLYNYYVIYSCIL